MVLTVWLFEDSSESASALRIRSDMFIAIAHFTSPPNSWEGFYISCQRLSPTIGTLPNHFEHFEKIRNGSELLFPFSVLEDLEELEHPLGDDFCLIVSQIFFEFLQIEPLELLYSIL